MTTRMTTRMKTMLVLLLNALAPLRRRLGPVFALMLALPWLLNVSACDQPPTPEELAQVSVSIQPGEMVFHPDTAPIGIAVVNEGRRPIPIQGFR